MPTALFWLIYSWEFDMHPHLDLLEQLVHIFGIPGILAGLIWLVRTYDKGVHQARELSKDASETRRMVLETLGGVTEIKTNHLIHVQEGLERLAGSNDKAVEVLQEIRSDMKVLVDRGR